jgi:homoserine O-acetyltransferase
LNIVGLYWIGVAAKLSPANISFWLMGIFLFYLPSAAVVIYLNRAHTLEDGLYEWTACVLRDFHFESGETLPELRMHYMTLGKPTRDAKGRVTNAVLILHGSGGSGRQSLAPQFADVLFGAGQLLDTNRYFVILPDNIGHGKSSKPSDGLHAHFPQYDYDDMVLAQYDLLTQGLGVNHLRLILGTSMGCMHSWVWGETYPDFMDAMMPLACLPVEITGRNRIWRKMVIDGIHQDPEWKNGEYTTQPRAGLQISTDFLIIAGTAPLPMQKTIPRARQPTSILMRQ